MLYTEAALVKLQKETSFYRIDAKATPDVLDMTCIHPESYDAVKQVVRFSGLDLADFQNQSARSKFQDKIKAWSRSVDLEKVRACLYARECVPAYAPGSPSYI